jgi:hypothetical protein
MSTSFTNKKALKFIITLGTGTFGSSGSNQITLQGFRAKVDIDRAGGVQMSTLRAQIYGVSQSAMNSTTTLQWKPGDQVSNTVRVFAIDGDQTTQVFYGYIVNAWGNYQNSPDVFLEIQAQAAYLQQLTPVAPLSFKGQTDVAQVMSQIAKQMGITFENNGVSTQLADTYLPNTSLEQAKNLAQQAGINLYVDDTVLAITPPNTPRSGIVPQVGPTSGLRGYPTFDGVGVNFETYFNPAIKFGGSVQLVTSITKAAGTWIVVSIGHHLESEKLNGAWFSQVKGNANGLAIT